MIAGWGFLESKQLKLVSVEARCLPSIGGLPSSCLLTTLYVGVESCTLTYCFRCCDNSASSKHILSFQTPRVDLARCGVASDLHLATAHMAEENTCPVCLEKFLETDDVQHLGCSHRMHQTCVDALMKAQLLTGVEQVRCPVCRQGGASPGPPSPTPTELDRLAEIPDVPLIADDQLVLDEVTMCMYIYI